MRISTASHLAHRHRIASRIVLCVETRVTNQNNVLVLPCLTMHSVSRTKRLIGHWIKVDSICDSSLRFSESSCRANDTQVSRPIKIHTSNVARVVLATLQYAGCGSFSNARDNVSSQDPSQTKSTVCVRSLIHTVMESTVRSIREAS